MSSEALTSDIRAEAPLQQAPATPFRDLDRYIALPRLGSLALSPDGSRLVTCVSVLNSAATEYVSALWEVDPAGERQARRITRSSKGESGAAFARNGDLDFTSARPNPDDPAEEAVPALWRLAAAGGEGRSCAVCQRPRAGVEDRLNLISLSPAEVGRQLQFLLTGIPITQVREDIRKVPIVARSAGGERLDPDRKSVG